MKQIRTVADGATKTQSDTEFVVGGLVAIEIGLLKLLARALDVSLSSLIVESLPRDSQMDEERSTSVGDSSDQGTIYLDAGTLGLHASLEEAARLSASTSPQAIVVDPLLGVSGASRYVYEELMRLPWKATYESVVYDAKRDLSSGNQPDVEAGQWSPEHHDKGARIRYASLIPNIGRYSWFPAPKATPYRSAHNVYESEYLAEFGKTQLDNHMLEREALALGLSIFRTGRLTFTAQDADGRSLAFSLMKSSASARTATAITSDKHSTRMILDDAGVPVPHGRRFGGDDVEQAIAYAESIGYPVVLKPLRGTGGKGVVVNINDEADLRWAFGALKGTGYEGRDVVVEEQIEGESGRAFVVGDRVLSMVQWPHGTVIGDGVLSVGELLLQKHKMRMNNPHLMNRPIRLDDATARQLGKQGFDFDSVPGDGEEVVFSLNPNPQQGGETVDAISELHPSFIEASVRAVKAIPGLLFSGVDWIIPDHTKDLSKQRAAICELNSRPSPGGHEFPLYGQNAAISRAIVREVAASGRVHLPDEAATRLTVRCTIYGNLRKEKYISWFRDRAVRFKLSGQISSHDDGAVVALLSGPTERVAALTSLAMVGPKGVTVDAVETTHISNDLREGIEVV